MMQTVFNFVEGISPLVPNLVPLSIAYTTLSCIDLFVDKFFAILGATFSYPFFPALIQNPTIIFFLLEIFVFPLYHK